MPDQQFTSQGVSYDQYLLIRFMIEIRNGNGTTLDSLDINFNCNARTALMIATQHGDLDTIQYLLNNGAGSAHLDNIFNQVVETDE